MKYVLYNPISGHGKSLDYAKSYESKAKNEAVEIIDMTTIGSYSDFIKGLKEEDSILISGGDGTINRFINDTKEIEIKNPIYYYPSGTGNDFCVDIGKSQDCEPFLLNDYIKNLPTVTVKGKSYKFINGVGYGIDGYCCEVGDKLHAEGKVPNYTKIAILGLLFHFKPTNATVIVDGKEEKYKKVWIAPTMYGNHYGGGMIPTPEQKRGSDELSLMIFHGSGKLKTLMIFPSIFKGEHVKNTKYVKTIKGKTITVKFDRPTPLQIDGETVLDVLEYTATI